MNADMKVIVRYTVAGFHHWPDAPPHRAYLAAPHRHLFYVEVSVGVTHDNRQVEFHDLLDFCQARFKGGDCGAQSCEQMARHLAEQVAKEWNVATATVSVFEDNECGAVITWQE